MSSLKFSNSDKVDVWILKVLLNIDVFQCCFVFIVVYCYHLMLQKFTSQQGSTDRIPLKNVDTRVTAIQISWIDPDTDQKSNIATTIFGCMERKLILQSTIFQQDFGEVLGESIHRGTREFLTDRLHLSV